LNRIEIVILG